MLFIIIPNRDILILNSGVMTRILSSKIYSLHSLLLVPSLHCYRYLQLMIIENDFLLLLIKTILDKSNIEDRELVM